MTERGAFYPLRVAEVRPETSEAVAVCFELDSEQRQQFAFTPGQFLTLRMAIDGCMTSRSYSICSDIADRSLRVAVKRVKNGVFSNYVNDNLKVGSFVEACLPEGNFVVDLNSEHSKNYICLAVGSGITPVLSIVKSILSIEKSSELTLIYGNRFSRSIMFKEELGALKNRYMQRFQWINILSQEDQGAEALAGRIDNAKGGMLQELKLIDVPSVDEAFICGPEAMMSEVSRGFRSAGLDQSQIHYELFASSAEDARQRLEKARQRVQNYGEGKSSRVQITAAGRSVAFDLAATGENILDAGLDHGMELPYSCKAGVCSTCKAKLVSGQVEMDVHHGLEPSEREAGYILCCQAHPVSEEVQVDFDLR